MKKVFFIMVCYSLIANAGELTWQEYLDGGVTKKEAFIPTKGDFTLKLRPQSSGWDLIRSGNPSFTQYFPLSKRFSLKLGCLTENEEYAGLLFTDVTNNAIRLAAFNTRDGSMQEDTEFLRKSDNDAGDNNIMSIGSLCLLALSLKRNEKNIEEISFAYANKTMIYGRCLYPKNQMVSDFKLYQNPHASLETIKSIQFDKEHNLEIVSLGQQGNERREMVKLQDLITHKQPLVQPSRRRIFSDCAII